MPNKHKLQKAGGASKMWSAPLKFPWHPGREVQTTAGCQKYLVGIRCWNDQLDLQAANLECDCKVTTGNAWVPS
jgi:hypothetical protein